MSPKPKLLIISGITGVGKSDIALKIAKFLRTDIIVGDSLQIYKNFPIASNFPDLPSLPPQMRYHFLGMFDVLKQRISAFQYKELLAPKIKEILEQKKVPLIEGGCGFYLNYALTSNDQCIEYNELKEAEKKARDIIDNKFNKDWDSSEQYLIKLCPTAVGFVPRNDFYRLEKAMKYAIASKGEFFKARDNEDSNERFKDIYDIRGIFLTKDIMQMYSDIQDRCDLMLERGYVDEVFEFLKTLNVRSLEGYDTMPIPLGYREATDFINELIDMGETKRNNRSIRLKLVREYLVSFASKFQIKTRQYAHYQMKFARKKFNNFQWIDTTQPKETILKAIVDTYECSRETYERNLVSEENMKLIGTYNDKKKTKLVKATPLQRNFDQAFSKLNSGILTTLGIEF